MNPKFLAGLFMMGMGLGIALPSLPEPLSILNPWLWIILLTIGIILIIVSTK